jgi:hypothetical protein
MNCRIPEHADFWALSSRRACKACETEAEDGIDSPIYRLQIDRRYCLLTISSPSGTSSVASDPETHTLGNGQRLRGSYLDLSSGKRQEGHFILEVATNVLSHVQFIQETITVGKVTRDAFVTEYNDRKNRAASMATRSMIQVYVCISK